MSDDTKPQSYWQTREGKLDQAIREGLRDAGVQGPLAHIVGPVLRKVLDATASDAPTTTDAAPSGEKRSYP
jgi:hypothetical protein